MRGKFVCLFVCLSYPLAPHLLHGRGLRAPYLAPTFLQRSLRGIELPAGHQYNV